MVQRVHVLSDRLEFPPVHHADDDGLLAIGGDLRPDRLLLAYRSGIFPWPTEGLPLLWFSPNPRLILRPGDVHVSKSLAKELRKVRWKVTFDTSFSYVIRACAQIPREGQPGTWITPSMIRAYECLHELGYAHSVEAWCDSKLAGGLYGVSLGAAFFGESMFSIVPNASKIALVTLAHQLERWGYHFIDCQMVTEHLLRFGACPLSRKEFLQYVGIALKFPDKKGSWTELVNVF